MKYKDFYKDLLIENSDIQYKLEKLRQAGQTQRDIPESVMLSVQHNIYKIHGPPLYTELLEHIGDLSFKAADGSIAEKVNRELKRVENLKNEWSDGLIRCAEFKLKVETGFDDWFWSDEGKKDPTRFDKQDKLFSDNKEKIRANVHQILEGIKKEAARYAEAHKKHNLPITTIGRLGKKAAIELGELKFDDVLDTLRKMKKWLTEYEKSGWSDEKLLQGYDENRHDYIEGEEIEEDNDDGKI